MQIQAFKRPSTEKYGKSSEKVGIIGVKQKV